MDSFHEIYDEYGTKIGDRNRSEIHSIPYWHKTVILLVINPKNKIILHKRPIDRLIDPGKLSFFGGHVESGETFRQAAKREISEELSIPLDKIQNTEIIPIGEEGEFKYKMDYSNLTNYEISSVFAYFVPKGMKIQPCEENLEKKTVKVETVEYTIEEFFSKYQDNSKDFSSSVKRIFDRTEHYDAFTPYNFVFNYLQELIHLSKKQRDSLLLEINTPFKDKQFMYNCFMTGRDCTEVRKVRQQLQRQWKSSIFVAMPFAKEYDYCLDDFKAKYEKLYHIIRSDEIETLGYIICGNICEPIQESDYTLVILTKDENRNVQYELGLAYGLNRKIILTTPKVRENKSYLPQLFPKIHLIESLEGELPFYKLDVDFSKERNNNVIILYHSQNLLDRLRKTFSLIKNQINCQPQYIPFETTISDSKTVLKQIVNAKSVIVELTQDATEGYFWTGLAHGIQKPIITIIDRNADQLPFDLRVLNHLTYRSDSPQSTLLQSELLSILKTIEEKEDNPMEKLWAPIIKRGQLKIVLGNQRTARDERIAVGNWDVKSSAVLLSYLNKRFSSVDIDVLDPLPYFDLEDSDKVQEIIASWSGSDLVIFGSPDANNGSALILDHLKSKNINRKIIKENLKRHAEKYPRSISEFYSNETELIHSNCPFKDKCKAQDYYDKKATEKPRNIHALSLTNKDGEKHIIGVCNWFNKDSTARSHAILSLGHLVILDNPYCSDDCYCKSSSSHHKIILIEGLSGPTTFDLTKMLCGEIKSKKIEPILSSISETLTKSDNIGEYLIYSKMTFNETEKIGIDDRIAEGVTEPFFEVMSNNNYHINENFIALNYNGMYYNPKQMKDMKFNNLPEDLRALLNEPSLGKRLEKKESKKQMN